MKKIKTDKTLTASGITLIALVVTIIVLLILAGVSLNLISGSDGILGRATSAENTYDASSAKEQAELFITDTLTAYYEEVYVDGTFSGSRLDYINNQIGSGTVIGDYFLKVATGGTAKVEKMQAVASLEKAYATAETLTELNIEVYRGTSSAGTKILEGTIDTNGNISWSDEVTQNSNAGGNDTPDPTAGIGEVNTTYSGSFGKLVTGTSVPTSGSNWRLFYADSNYVYLISDSIETKALNNSMAGYGGDMTSDDFILGRNLNSKFATWDMKSDGTNVNSNIKKVAALLDTSKWTTYESSDAEWAIGAPSLEMFIASYNATHTSQILCDVPSDAYGYKVKWSTDSGYADTITGLGNTENLDRAIYVRSDEGWWLSTPSANNYGHMMLISGLDNKDDISCTAYGGDSYSVRPVVCIPISKINNGITIGTNYFNN